MHREGRKNVVGRLRNIYHVLKRYVAVTPKHEAYVSNTAYSPRLPRLAPDCSGTRTKGVRNEMPEVVGDGHLGGIDNVPVIPGIQRLGLFTAPPGAHDVDLVRSRDRFQAT